MTKNDKETEVEQNLPKVTNGGAAKWDVSTYGDFLQESTQRELQLRYCKDFKMLFY